MGSFDGNVIGFSLVTIDEIILDINKGTEMGSLIGSSVLYIYENLDV